MSAAIIGFAVFIVLVFLLVWYIESKHASTAFDSISNVSGKYAGIAGGISSGAVYGGDGSTATPVVGGACSSATVAPTSPVIPKTSFTQDISSASQLVEGIVDLQYIIGLTNTSFAALIPAMSNFISSFNALNVDFGAYFVNLYNTTATAATKLTLDANIPGLATDGSNGIALACGAINSSSINYASIVSSVQNIIVAYYEYLAFCSVNSSGTANGVNTLGYDVMCIDATSSTATNSSVGNSLYSSVCNAYPAYASQVSGSSASTTAALATLNAYAKQALNVFVNYITTFYNGIGTASAPGQLACFVNSYTCNKCSQNSTALAAGPAPIQAFGTAWTNFCTAVTAVNAATVANSGFATVYAGLASSIAYYDPYFNIIPVAQIYIVSQANNASLGSLPADITALAAAASSFSTAHSAMITTIATTIASKTVATDTFSLEEALQTNIYYALFTSSSYSTSTGNPAATATTVPSQTIVDFSNFQSVLVGASTPLTAALNVVTTSLSSASSTSGPLSALNALIASSPTTATITTMFTTGIAAPATTITSLNALSSWLLYWYNVMTGYNEALSSNLQTSTNMTMRDVIITETRSLGTVLCAINVVVGDINSIYNKITVSTTGLEPAIPLPSKISCAASVSGFDNRAMIDRAFSDALVSSRPSISSFGNMSNFDNRAMLDRAFSDAVANSSTGMVGVSHFDDRAMIDQAFSDAVTSSMPISKFDNRAMIDRAFSDAVNSSGFADGARLRFL